MYLRLYKVHSILFQSYNYHRLAKIFNSPLLKCKRQNSSQEDFFRVVMGPRSRVRKGRNDLGNEEAKVIANE